MHEPQSTAHTKGKDPGLCQILLVLISQNSIEDALSPAHFYSMKESFEYYLIFAQQLTFDQLEASAKMTESQGQNQ